MLLNNICRDDLGMVYLGSLRYCLLKKEDEDMFMLLTIVKRLQKYLARRDFSCSLEDLINTNRFFGDVYDFTKNYESEDCITLLTHYMLANLVNIDLDKDNKENVDVETLYRIFVDLNYFAFHDVNRDEAYEFINGILKSRNFINALNETKIDFDFGDANDIIEIELELDELSFLCKNAIHYAVGRRTYVTSMVPQFILSVKSNLNKETKEYIKDYILSLKKKDDENSTEYKSLGDNCDRISWLRLVDNL